MYGASGEIRTLDPMIKSHVLYQLSYGSMYRQKLLMVNNCSRVASVKGRKDIDRNISNRYYNHCIILYDNIIQNLVIFQKIFQIKNAQTTSY